MRTNLLLLPMIIGFCSAFSQQKASQRPISVILSEIKQQQAERNKMLQQIKQATPSDNAAQNGSIPLQPAAANTPTQQRSQPVQKIVQQPIINKQTHSQLPSSKVKKE